jgi:hypothetical protein
MVCPGLIEPFFPLTKRMKLPNRGLVILTVSQFDLCCAMIKRLELLRYKVAVWVAIILVCGIHVRCDGAQCSSNEREWIGYRNDPVKNLDVVGKQRLQAALSMTVSKPTGLLHRAAPNGHDSILGLTTYTSFLRGYRRFAGSLRKFGFTGHIILGVHPDMAPGDANLLKALDVTFYEVKNVACDQSISTKEEVRGTIRGKCAQGLETLKLEWARFELARQWLHDCIGCTGWSMVMDVRDSFFQADPFALLPAALALNQKAWTGRTGLSCLQQYFYNSSVDLYFVEEIGPLSSPIKDKSRYFVAGNPRCTVHTEPCYGKNSVEPYRDRPVLCSGTVIGTRVGIMRFLNVLVDEFHHNNNNGNVLCRSPKTTDQWTMNWLYYNGRFGYPNQTMTLPYGVGPVLTVGKACMTKDKKTGATDIVKFGPPSEGGFIMNGIEGTVAPVVHQVF